MYNKSKYIYSASEKLFNNLNYNKNNLNRNLKILNRNGRKTSYYEIKPITYNHEFNSSILKYICTEIKKYIKLPQRGIVPIDVCIDLSNIKVWRDKNTYILLDLALYYLINKTRDMENIYLKNRFADENYFGKMKSKGILNTAFFNSIAQIDNNKVIIGELINKNKFKIFYEKNHFSNTELMNILSDNEKPAFYRRIIVGEEYKSKKLESIVATELTSLLNMYIEDDDWVWDVVLVISEVISNAEKHNSGFMLIDLDVSDRLYYSKEENKNYYEGVNISLINVGNHLLYDRIMNNVTSMEFNPEVDIYRTVYEAYDNHKKYFCEDYTKEDFFIITAFQNRVTTRYGYKENDGKISGTGLTDIIKKIKSKTKEDLSYVLSGDKGLLFLDEFLDFDINNNNFIGFNLQRDYKNYRPSNKVIIESDFFIPGTIFQLELVKNNERMMSNEKN